jgi:predicted dehydrogenase
MPKRSSLSVALIGTKFMGRAHSNAWRQAPHFFDLPADIRMAVICGRDPASTRRAAKALGWENSSTDWRAIIADPQIDIIDICTPNDSHSEIAIVAANAGKAILCEKPLARTVAEAERMAATVKRANMVCHNYRRVPAIALAKQMIENGELGQRIYHFRARYAQDWIANEDFPMVWRLKKEIAGSGALGDIGAHIIDLARYLVGEIASVFAVSETFVKRRPTRNRPHLNPILRGEEDAPHAGKEAGSPRLVATGLRAARGAGRTFGRVDADDAVSVIGRFRNGAILNLEATRFAYGRKNALSFEINGSRGSLCFDLEDLNRLRFYDASDPEHARGFRDIIVTEPSHPYAAHWWPPGHLLGYEHSFVHTIADFVRAVISGKRAQPDFADGLRTQRVLDAIIRSARGGGKAGRL